MGTVRPRNNYGAILDAGKLKAFTYNMHDVHVVRGLELSQVRLLAELSRANGITSAASNIGLSQSAASHALAKLRKQLGDPLFLRTGNGLRPTPYGQRVGLAAREALEVLVTGLASNRPFEPRTATRTFSCYMSDVGMMVMLPSLMTYMKKHAPGSSVRSAPIPLINPGGSLSSGDVDVAVGFFDNLSSGFLQRFLFRERYVCIVRSGHAGFRGGMSVEVLQEGRARNGRRNWHGPRGDRSQLGKTQDPADHCVARPWFPDAAGHRRQFRLGGHHSRAACGHIRPAPANQGSADAYTNAGFRRSALLARTLSSRSASSLVSTSVRRTV